jgi:RNA polymerase sigma-70 factor (ECF subfamily)
MSDFHRQIEEQIPRLRRYARALTRNPDRADDLLQDTLVRALDKQHLWQPGTNLRAWLFTLMHNQNINAIRRNEPLKSSVDIDDTAIALTAVSDTQAASKLAELDRALGKLPQNQRAVILLIGLEGMSYEEAAAVLKVAIGTIRSRLSRGREALRRLMDGETTALAEAA